MFYSMLCYVSKRCSEVLGWSNHSGWVNESDVGGEFLLLVILYKKGDDGNVALVHGRSNVIVFNCIHFHFEYPSVHPKIRVPSL